MVFPMVAGLISAWVLSGSWVAYLYMGLVGATMGIGSTIKPALFAEIYGRNLVGTVQSLYSTFMVFSTAVMPFLVGSMMDASFSIESILMLAIVSCLLPVLFAVR